MITDEQDIQSAALCAWKEARGEGPEGCLAVLCVLRNRVGYTGFPFDLHSVIYAKNQFTSMSVPTDPQFNLQPAEDDATYKLCLTMAANVFNDQQLDVTNGAHYYANLHNVTSGWFLDNIVKNPNHPVTEQIGRHTFFV